MFFIVRTKSTKEILGIVDERMVLRPEAVGTMVDDLWRNWTGHILPDEWISEDCMRAATWTVIEKNVVDSVKHCQDWWYWKEISQAEFETYRDLHGFKVFTDGTNETTTRT